MNILVFNCGSSSQAFKVYRSEPRRPEAVLIAGKAKNVATPTQARPYIHWEINGKPFEKKCPLDSHKAAAEQILAILRENGIRPDAVGHRFVHGGRLLQKNVRIDAETRALLLRCLPLAPIHNPNSFSVIEVCEEQLPDIPQFAVFDTAFHAGMPEAAKRYALPTELVEKFGFQKYGFHGLSCQFVTKQAARLMGKPAEALRLIICHLGTGGSSVTAVRNGETLDTSMGYSPLAGLVMSTRCGDLDPGIPLDLVRAGIPLERIDEILNRESGLLGLSGFSSSLPEIITAAGEGNPACRIAYDVYVHRLRKYIGAFYWLLAGADAILFTDDVGERCWQVRERVFESADFLGIFLDHERNRTAAGDSAACISRPDSKVQLWAIPTDEEQVIFHEVLSLLKS